MQPVPGMPMMQSMQEKPVTSTTHRPEGSSADKRADTDEYAMAGPNKVAPKVAPARPDPEQYRKRIAEALFLHPRVAYQKLAVTDEERRKLAAAVPDLLPFGDNEYHRFLPVLDWDHRLPSKQLILRVYAYYSEESAALGGADRDARMARISKLDKFPEFDVPDFAEMVSDEAYDIVVGLDGKPTSCRLTSPWRREIEGAEAARAVCAVKRSREFIDIMEAFSDRPENLGDAEAVSYTPPCESGYKGWTLDVWYLVAYDGMHGKGRSFLVDLETEEVVAVREFTVRPD